MVVHLKRHISFSSGEIWNISYFMYFLWSLWQFHLVVLQSTMWIFQIASLNCIKKKTSLSSEFKITLHICSCHLAYLMNPSLLLCLLMPSSTLIIFWHILFLMNKKVQFSQHLGMLPYSIWESLKHSEIGDFQWLIKTYIS